MAVRKITKAGGRKLVSKFPSVKLRRIVRCESPLERDYVYLLEFGRAKFYEEQPLRIRYYLDGKRRRYTPDFLVTVGEKKLIVEVKLESVALKKKYRTLFAIASQICRREGYVFVVVTEKMIRVQPRLSNIKKLYRYAKVPLTTRCQTECYQFLEGRCGVSVKALAEFLGARGVEEPLQVVYALMYWGFVEFDMAIRIGSGSIISLPKSVYGKGAGHTCQA